MDHCFRAKIAAFSIIVISGIITAGYCGGIWLYENGTPETGTAGVGYPARAQDASTVFGNPAGMTRLNGLNYLVGLPIAAQTNKFSVDSATFGGGGGGNAGGTRFSYGLYYENQPLRKSFPGLRTGFITNTYTGVILDYADTWAGRYYTQKSELQTINSSTVAAYPITPWFSIGIGFYTVYGKLILRAAVNNGPGTAATDGQVKVENYNMSAGGNAGLLFLPLPNLRFGVTYRSPVNLRFRNALGFTKVRVTLLDTLAGIGVLGKTFNMDLRIPQEIATGFYIDLTDKIAIMADWNWQNWSNFLHFNITSPTDTFFLTKPKLSDTYHIGIGFQFRPLSPLLLTTGFSWDSSPESDSSRAPNFPVDRQFRYAGGIEYYITRWFTIGGSYEYIGLGKAQIEQRRALAGTLIGHYSSNRVNVFTIYAKGQL